MSKKFDGDWVDVQDDDGDWEDDEGVIDEDYNEDKFQREYEQYMKSLSKSSSSKPSTTTTTNKPSASSVLVTTSNTTSTTETSGEKKEESKSHPKHHHHKRDISHLKDHHTPPIKPSSSPSITSNSGSSTNDNSKTTPTVASTTSATTTNTATTPSTNATTTTTPIKAIQRPVNNETKSSQPEIQQPVQQNNERRVYERRNIKEHKPQTERKKHRSEQEAVEFIKILLFKLLSSYDKVYASSRLTPEIYENTRHKLLKNFSFYKNSESMQTAWVDILFEKVLERGISGTICSLLHEQLEENVSRLPQEVIVSVKRKIATKCQKLFKEELTVQNKVNELEQEFQFYKKKSNTLSLIANLVSSNILERKIAFFIISDLLGNPTEFNLKLVCEFLLEVGYRIDSASTKTVMDGFMDTIKKLSKDEKTPKLIRLDLLKVLDSREKNKFANIDEQFMFIQHELKVIQLENELAEFTEKPAQNQPHHQTSNHQ